MVTSPTAENEIALTPAMRETLSGSFGRRRHKLKMLEAGNVAGNSAQGADFLLNESVYLANRRGNELWIRDSDQAIVTRSLQRFHAGAGVRLYSGMVQRDSTLLPTQMFTDTVNWTSDRQVNEQGIAIPSNDLEGESTSGVFAPADVFNPEKLLRMGYSDPTDVLRRGLYIDEEGQIYDSLVTPDATYGGKTMFRVSTDPNLNGILDPSADVFTEWRVEVSHTSDGTLPVTEQTDGVDIDRINNSSPQLGADGTGDPNPLIRSANARMVSMVMGTAIGNDPINDRENYGRPLVPSLFDKNGAFAPGIRAAEPGTPITEHAAWMVRVRNPADPKGPEAYMAITKGGAFRSYFPGAGSKGHEEFYQTGKQVSLGADKDGQSYLVEADGTISLRNTGRGRPGDNIGVEMSSEGGGVFLYAGSPITEGASTSTSDPNLTPASQGIAMLLRSARSTLLEAVDTMKLAGQRIKLEDADTIEATANTTIAMNAGDTISMTAKVFGVTINGKAEYNFGGPKNALPTNGASRVTTFSSIPLTGGIGGVVDDYSVIFGGRKEVYRLGRKTTLLNVGSYNVHTMTTPRPALGPGAGVKMTTGLPGLDNVLSLTPVSASLTANVGNATVQATKGFATLRGTLGVAVQSPLSVSITAPFIKVNTPTPFIGGVLTDGCLNAFTGRSFLLSGTLGVATFRV
jgi:hypothetical protein